jgi:prephenate dehydrogenase
MEAVAIVGVGLIGGSFALALRKAGFKGRILGVSSPATVEEALRRGVIDEATSLEDAARSSDLIYLSQPIRRILETIPQLEAVARPEALITDAGSTKAEICRTARRHLRRARFLGGHPMAGKESRGVAEAEADLFTDRPYVLTPAERTDLDSPQAVEFVDWLHRIGARPVVFSAEEHDRQVAFTSHLPQLVSTALAATLDSHEQSEKLEKIAGPGLRDMTRLALSPYDIWRDIFETNSEAVLAALDAYIRRLEAIRAAFGDNLEEQFRRAAEFTRRLRGR